MIDTQYRKLPAYKAAAIALLDAATVLSTSTWSNRYHKSKASDYRAIAKRLLTREGTKP